MSSDDSSPPSSSTASTARRLLQESSWFHDASDSLLDALAGLMIPVASSCEMGDVLVHEGDVMSQIFVLEQGSLLRSKLSVDDPQQVSDVRQSVRHLQQAMQQGGMLESNSIVVDVIQGRGRISGLLHSLSSQQQIEEERAFATVSVAQADTKVWTISSDDFKDLVSSTPEYALAVMHALARELRSGSKSLRGLMHRLQQQGQQDQSQSSSDLILFRVLCYDATSWTTAGFQDALPAFHEKYPQFRVHLDYTPERLSSRSATYAAGYDAVCLFVNDTADADVLKTLSLLGVQLVSLRCAGFDRVDTKVARAYNVSVTRVPAYSPYAVAEMAIALLMGVNRKLARASSRVKMANFTLDAGLMGMDIHGKTVGVMGTGKIGHILCDILLGFGVARLLTYDVYENDVLKTKGATYVTQDEIFKQADILFLMMPLLPQTKHTINMDTLGKLKKGVILINTSRGGLVDTKALLEGLRQNIIGGVGMDVYENESEYFFQDWSAKHIADRDLEALLGNHNVMLTAHQAFFTREAVDKIVDTTLENFYQFRVQGLTGQAHPNNCIPALKE